MVAKYDKLINGIYLLKIECQLDMEMTSVDDAERERGPWHRNLIVLWFCTFVAGMAFSEIMPFLSLFVSQLGDFTKAQITFYSGLAFAADYAISAISAPLWGIIADKRS